MNDVDNTRKYTHLSLCAGYGGIDLGLKGAGFDIDGTVFVEVEAFASYNLAKKIEAGALGTGVIWPDLKTFPFRRFRGCFDILSGGFPCFTAGHLIQTERGLVPIEEIQRGDRVLTHEGRYKRVLSTMRKEGARTIEIKGQGFDSIECTPEHPFYTRRRTYEKGKRHFGSPSWTEADKLSRDTFLCETIPTLREHCKHSENWMWLAGRYVADGHRVARKNRPEGSGRVVFSVGKRKTGELEQRIKREFGTVTKTEERTAIRYHVVRNNYFQDMSEFGGHADTKKIPGWVFRVEEKYQQAFLDGYLAGDGNLRDNGSWRANTVSKLLAYGIAHLWRCARNPIGGIRSQRTADTTIIEGRTVNQRDYYVIDLPSRNKVAFSEGVRGWKMLRSVTDLSNNRTVYNIEVEDDNSYTVNGVVVHNCQPFSQAGKQKGDEDPRHLFPFILRGIYECRPGLVVLENVEGIVSAKLKGDHWRDPAGTPVLLHVLRELERVGYRATAVASSASEVGAPHQRNRWFIIGVADTELSSSSRLEYICSVVGASSEAKEHQACTRRFGVWPSRPGQEQYEWEPPRVVGNPDSIDGRTPAIGRGHEAETRPASEEELGKPSSEGFQNGGGSPMGQCSREEPEPERSGSEELGNAELDGYSSPKDRRSIGKEPVQGRYFKPEQGETREVGQSEGAGNERGDACRSERGLVDAEPSEQGCLRCGDVPEKSRLTEFGSEREEESRQFESPMGGNPDGPTCGMDYAELCVSCDNRTDELRLLGNGVVPQSCSDAIIRGLKELMKWN